jgi:hypothetical protein
MKASSLFAASLALATLLIAPANAAPPASAAPTSSAPRNSPYPWIGCSDSVGYNLSPTCRNMGNYKTFIECMEAGRKLGEQSNGPSWYCSSLGLK